MFTLRLYLLISIAASAACGSSAMAEPPVRVWTDVTGRFQAEARLMEVKAGSVLLKRADNGKMIAIGIQQLSQLDQQFLANQALPDESEYSGKALSLNLKQWPVFLEMPPKCSESPEGMFVSGDIRTKARDHLDRDFTFEVVFPLKSGSPIVVVGIGRNRDRESVFMRIHHEYLRSGVGLAKNGQTSGAKAIGGDLPTGTHRAVVTRKGNNVTFGVDIDNDGFDEDDIQYTVPNLLEFNPQLSRKGAHLFFGHGTFNQVKLTYWKANQTTEAN